MLQDAFTINLGVPLEHTEVNRKQANKNHLISALVREDIQVTTTLPADRITKFAFPNRLLIAISEAPIRLAKLESQKLSKISTVDDLHNWQNSVPGIWTVLLIKTDEIFIRTDLMQNSLIYCLKHRQGLTLTNRPETLKRGMVTLDESLIAASMLYPGPPIATDKSDLSGTLPNLDPGCVYLIEASGYKKLREKKLPRPSRHFSLDVNKLQESIISAVTRVRSDSLGADLSGGYDSTTICFLLERHADHYQTFSGVGRSKASQDRHWAEQALHHLTKAVPNFWSPAESPHCFDYDPYQSILPFSGVANAAKIRWSARCAKRQGIDVLIGGHGGDELFDVDENSIFHTWKTNPVATWRNMQLYKGMYRWEMPSVVKEIAFPTSLRKRYKDFSEKSGEKPDTLSLTPNKWMLTRWYTPAWLTTHGKQCLENALQSHIPTKRLGASWAEKYHSILSDSASVTRHLRWIYAEEGVTLRTPYLDESLFRTMCEQNPALLADPLTPKRGLVEAMQGVVPGYIYQRRTKDIGLPDIYRGWEKNKARLAQELATWETCQLQVIDRETLRSYILRTSGTTIEPIALWRAIATETAIKALGSNNAVE